MRLSENNILFIKELRKDGITYEWFVCMKSRNASDSRQYVNYDKTGKTIIASYEKERLPKAAQNFLAKSSCMLEEENNGFSHYIYI